MMSAPRPGGAAPWPAAILVALLALWLPAAAAAPDYPALTGRVVDEAELLSPAGRAELEQNLEQHERATGNQVVVVTLRSLQRLSIEEYGVGLGRHWGIGRAGEDNGVLLIVAPTERAVRIEVGYGLEGTLTDALASLIIQREILPRFRKGNMAAGVVVGTRAILQALEGSYTPSAPAPAAPAASTQRGDSSGERFLLVFAIMAGLLAVIVMFRSRGGERDEPGNDDDSDDFGRDRGFTTGSGSSFSGGGGSFGGGGASGRW